MTHLHLDIGPGFRPGVSPDPFPALAAALPLARLLVTQVTVDRSSLVSEASRT